MDRFNIILIASLATGQAALWSQTQSHSADTTKISPNLVSFYEVPLACPAARGLGCGSAAKPVLQALEKKSSIQEAWLDHAGTTLAIVWKKGTKPATRISEVGSVADDRGISLRELTAERRSENFKSFESRNGWYRGTEVDRLSAEEASIIVDRLIRRAALKEPTISEKTDALRSALTKVIREQLTGCTSTQCREDCHKKLTEVARQNLNEREFRALIDAEKQGYRPVGGEQ